jgi:hypothetical protein
MTGMDKKRELRTHWQRACKLVLAKEDVLTVSRALELALFMDAKLDVSKVGGRIFQFDQTMGGLPCKV